MQPAPSDMKYSPVQLAELLTQSRFYGAKGVGISDVQVLRTAPLLGGDKACQLVLVQVTQEPDATGQVEQSFYQLCLAGEGRTDADIPKDLLAEGDSAALAAVVAACAQHEAPGGLGEFTAVGDISIDAAADIRVIAGEQSNTSVIIRQPDSESGLMLKFFRKLEAGINPDVELLSLIGDCPAVAGVRGYVDIAEPRIGGHATLAMLQDLVPGAQDAWEVALHSAEHDHEHTAFAPAAEAMGVATAQVHQALAQACSVDTVPKAEVIAGFRERLAEAIRQAPILADVQAQALEFYTRLAEELPDEVAVQRIHGDLHLGQILKSSAGRWVLIDFEGEPARPLSERRRKDSALRDVAGMLRSFDYAGYAAGRPQPQDWVHASQAAFLRGYGLEGSSGLVDAYVLDKALYEVAYEVNNRPTWVHIPLGAVKRIISSDAFADTEQGIT